MVNSLVESLSSSAGETGLTPAKKIAVVQSSYIPWKGYFDLINQVDEFILFDDVQYTRRDWRNRNKIKTPNGTDWLSIPVETRGNYFEAIKEIKVADGKWAQSHLGAIDQNYRQAACYKTHMPLVREWLNRASELTHLSEVNRYLLAEICKFLEIKTRLTWSWEYGYHTGKNERLISLVRAAGGDYYLSGPTAKSYIEPKMFEDAGVTLGWMNYENRDYAQPFPPFDPYVSILDLVLCVGDNARDYLKSVSV